MRTREKVYPKRGVLRELRMRRGLGSRELSERLGFSPSLVSAIETQAYSVRPATAKAICEYFGTPFDTMFFVGKQQKDGQEKRNMTLMEAVGILDSIIPDPLDKMVDAEHLDIAIAWSTIKRQLKEERHEPD